MTKVLVVDDEDDTLEVLCEMLRMNGFEVVGMGRNGREAHELYEKLKPDIVLSDVLMPDFDGRYGLQKILEFDPHAKVVMVTASALTYGDKTELLSMGALEVVIKPYEMDDLFKIIEELSSEVISKSGKLTT